jgi:hypothetical protein
MVVPMGALDGLAAVGDQHGPGGEGGLSGSLYR